MSSDVTTSFLTYYIQSLAERTRVEKSSTKIGFDWIIYNLALAEDLIPYRLPFFRGGSNEISKTKTEPEFGIDLAFLSPDKKLLIIFVLKDERLTNTTWISNDFDPDLRKAACPNLTTPELIGIKNVKIVLAYNKDEDQTGIQLFLNLINTLGTKLSNSIQLSFERWNLTVITEKVKSRLLTPSLLPQKFFSHFAYICSQFGDFRHGSDEWNNQLVPNWQRFLHELLKENVEERTVRLVPVALIILREHGKTNPSAETGWFDLAEWAMIAAWQVFQTTDKKSVKQAIPQMWFDLYLSGLTLYYKQHTRELSVEHSITTEHYRSNLDSIASAIITFWHIARLGILSMAYAELPTSNENDKQKKVIAENQIGNWLISLLNANPAAIRPLLDIHHIELFLIWQSLIQLGRTDVIYTWLQKLHLYLTIRRSKRVPLPFIEGGNSLDLVFEHVATGIRPPDFCDQSSLLMLCILEFCCCLKPSQRNELLAAYYRNIVLGQEFNGQQIRDSEPIDLMGWSPPDDWTQKVLVQSLANEGDSQVFESFDLPSGANGELIFNRINQFVTQIRSTRKYELPTTIPTSVIVLACLKFRSPLPAELWRRFIFTMSDMNQESCSEKEN
jgi:hypothetical protein